MSWQADTAQGGTLSWKARDCSVNEWQRHVAAISAHRRLKKRRGTHLSVAQTETKLEDKVFCQCFARHLGTADEKTAVKKIPQGPC